MANGIQRTSQPSDLPSRELFGEEEELISQQQQQVPAAGISIDALLKQFDQEQAVPVPVAGAVPAGPDEVDALLQQFDQKPGFAIEPGELPILETAALSFATTDSEKRDRLTTTFGEDNVRKDKKGFLFRKSIKDKFKRVSDDDFDLFNDLFAANARTILEVATDIGVTTGLTFGGGPVGLVAGGAVAGIAAVTIGDLIAEQFLDIERDPTRDRLTETAVSGALGGTFAGLAAVGGKLLSRVKRNKSIAETSERPIDTIIDHSKDILDDIAELEKIGLETEVLGADGKRLKLLITNLESNNPAIKKIQKNIIEEGAFPQIERKLGESTVLNVNQILKSVGNTKGLVNLRESLDKAPSDISKKVVEFVKTLKAQDGRNIKKFKKKAGKLFKTTAGDMDQVPKTLGRIFSSDQLNIKAANLADLEPTALAGKLIVKKTTAVDEFSTVLIDLNAKLANKGGLSPAEFEEPIKKLADLLNSGAVKKEPNFRRIVKSLNSALRSDRRKVVEAALPDNLKGGFNAAMDRFSKISRATEQVDELLSGSELASKAFIKTIFNKGKEGVPDLLAAKSIIEPDNPGLWKELVGDFLDETIRDVTKDGIIPLSMQTFSKKLVDFGPGFTAEIFKNAPFKAIDLQRALRVASQVERTSNFNTKLGSDVLKNAVGAQSNFTTAKLNAFIRMFKTVFGINARKFLTQTGFDDFMTKVPFDLRDTLKAKMELALKFLAEKPAKAVAVGIRQEVREEVRE